MIRSFTFIIIYFSIFYSHVSLWSESLPEKPDGHITDITKTLNPEAIKKLENLAQTIEKKFTHQVYVLVANSLEGRPLEEVTISIAEQWKIGKKGADNGIILFFFLKDRKVRIEVGYGLEGIITDALANQIIQKGIIPTLKQQDLASAIEIALQSFEIAFASKDNAKDVLDSIFNEPNESKPWTLDQVLLYILLGSFGAIGIYWIWMKWPISAFEYKPDPKIFQSKVLKALEFLKESNPFWSQTKSKYDPEVVESKRTELLKKGNSLLEQWKLHPQKEEAKLQFWLSDVEKIQTSTKEVFPLSSDQLVSRIENQWKDFPWESWKTEYSPESVAYQTKELEKRKEILLRSKDPKEIEKFLNILKSVKREPELFFYPNWEKVVTDTEQWIEDQKLWKKYESTYEKKKVVSHKEMIVDRLNTWKLSAPVSPEEKLKANRFWIANVIAVKTTPEQYFKKNNTRKTNNEAVWTTTTSDSSSESYSSNSDSNFESSSKFDSDSSTSDRGGEFGGGGASGSW